MTNREATAYGFGIGIILLAWVIAVLLIFGDAPKRPTLPADAKPSAELAR